MVLWFIILMSQKDSTFSLNSTFQFAKCFCKYKTVEIYRGYGVGHIFIDQKPEAQKVR